MNFRNKHICIFKESQNEAPINFKTMQKQLLYLLAGVLIFVLFTVTHIMRKNRLIGGEYFLAVIPNQRQIHAQLLIGRTDGETWVDVSDFLAKADVECGSIEDLGTGTGTDIGVRTLDFTLQNDGQNTQVWYSDDVLGDSGDLWGDTTDIIGDTADDLLPFLISVLGTPDWLRESFTPKDKNSDWNNFGGKWSPLLWPYREVALRVAVTDVGVAPLDWVTLFEGYMGDAIATDHHTVVVRCRDKSKRLLDAYIDVAKTYKGPMSPEAYMQAILNDYMADPPALYCPVPSGITFDEYTVEYVSVWGAIEKLATQIGWFLGYRWNGTEYALTFIEPPREKSTADFVLGWEDDIYTESLNISDADIRNAVTLTYRDKTLGKRVTLRYTDHPELRNEASKDEYGRQYKVMQIEEKDTSLIDTQTKALDFGAKCLWDVSELSGTDKLDIPFLPELDLFSTIERHNPLISSTRDFFAVQSIRHTLDFSNDGKFRTEIIATDRVVGARSKWLRMETRPGRDGDPAKHGKTSYTWIKYANTPTTGMSDSPEGKTYIGIAYNKEVPDESTNYTDYTWALIRGADGLPGPPGADGDSLYTWIRYADTPTSGMSSDPANKKYIGIAYNKITPTPSSNYGDYTWSLIEGPQGPPGQNGRDGEPGEKGDPGPGTPYLGEHDPTKIYYNRSNRRDVVRIIDGGQKKYYIYKGPDGVSGAWDPDNWEYYGDTLDFVATKLLLAEDASISKTLNVGQGGTSRAGVSGEGDYRFWSGDESPADAPFSVNEAGHATVNSMRAINKDKPDAWIEIDAGRLNMYKNGKLYQPMQRWEIGTITNGQTKVFERPFSGVPKIYLFPSSILTYSSNPAHANKNQRLVCQVEDVTPTTLQARIALVVDDGHVSEINHPVGSALASSYSNYDWQTNPSNRPGFTVPYVVPDSTVTVNNVGYVNFSVSATAYIFVVEEIKDYYSGDLVGTSYYNKTADYAASFNLILQAYRGGTWINIKTWQVSSTQISDPAQGVRYYATDNAGGVDTQYRLVVSQIALPIGMRGPVLMDTTLNGWGTAFRVEVSGPVTQSEYHTYCDLVYGVLSMEISNTSDQIIHNGTAQYFAIEEY